MRLDDRSPSDDPVEITFWYALGGENKGRWRMLTQEFNESQNAVRVRLENQSGYTEMIEKYRQSGQAARPDMVMLPEYIVQEMVDSDSVVPVEACIEASDFDTSPFIERTLDAYATAGDPVGDAVQRVEPGALLQQDGVRRGRSRPGRAAADARSSCTVRRAAGVVGRRRCRDRVRERHRQRRRVVHRAVAGEGPAAVRQQQQRPLGSGDAGALRQRAHDRVLHRAAVDGRGRVGRLPRRQLGDRLRPDARDGRSADARRRWRIATLGCARHGARRARRRSDPRRHRGRHRRRPDARTRAGSRVPSSAVRRCTSCPSAATR